MAKNGGPARDAPEDWLVWHFTHRDNLEAILEAGAILPASDVQPIRSVANQSVKDRRTYSVDPDADYPESTVHDHVPFYLTAKSPMLYAVTSPGDAPYKADSSDLVFMGVLLGDLVDSGMTWCVSNGNAASEYTDFSRELSDLGAFVDFDLLGQRMWRNTTDDPHRQGRRAAECLVYGEVPLEYVRVVVTRDEEGLADARAAFESVGGSRQYHAMRDVFYF